MVESQSDHICLISVSQSIFATRSLREVVAPVLKLGSGIKVSSVYRIFRGAEIQFTAVMRLQTSFSLDELYNRLRDLEQTFPSSECLLLCYENEVRLTPELALPFPKWMREAHLLIPSAEVWGDYHHPVSDKNLYQLAQNFAGQPWGEFYAQGQTLLDF